MMKVTNNMRNDTIEFKKLAIGDAYYDADGFLCIKVCDSDWDGTAMSISLIEGGWETTEEHDDNPCIPLKSELVLLGYK